MEQRSQYRGLVFQWASQILKQWQGPVTWVWIARNLSQQFVKQTHRLTIHNKIRIILDPTREGDDGIYCILRWTIQRQGECVNLTVLTQQQPATSPRPTTTTRTTAVATTSWSTQQTATPTDTPMQPSSEGSKPSSSSPTPKFVSANTQTTTKPSPVSIATKLPPKTLSPSKPTTTFASPDPMSANGQPYTSAAQSRALSESFHHQSFSKADTTERTQVSSGSSWHPSWRRPSKVYRLSLLILISLFASCWLV